MSRASGAGAYSQPAGAGTEASLFSTSVNGEVVRALVAAGLLLADLHQHVVQERRGAEPVEVGRQPLRAERLVELDEVLDRLLRLADAAGGLHTDLPSGLLVDVADRLQHDQRHWQRGGRGELAGRRLDEVGPRGHGQDRGAARSEEHTSELQ